MPSNVVKTAEQERLWKKAKALAAKQGHPHEYDYIMGIFKQMGGLEKSYGSAVLPMARGVRWPGQVPKEAADPFAMPEPLSTDRLLAQDGPMLTAGAVASDLGLEPGQERDLARFVEESVGGAPSELQARQALHVELRERNYGPELRRAIAQRAVRYWRGQNEGKSMKKALFIGPRGGKWADAKHTIPFDPVKHGGGKRIFVIDKTKPRRKAKPKVAKPQVKPMQGGEESTHGTAATRAIEQVPTAAEKRSTSLKPKTRLSGKPKQAQPAQLGLFELPPTKPIGQAKPQPQIGRADYAERQEARKERLESRAAKARAKAEAADRAARETADKIPMGQPILVGHHSEKRARRDADRIHNKMGEMIAQQKKAEALASRAESVGRYGISSDDPEALVKLKEKYLALEKQREAAKLINRLYKKHKGDWAKIQAEGGLSDKRVAAIQARMSTDVYDKPFPGYHLSNLGAKIRTAKKRVDDLLAESERRQTPAGPQLAGRGWKVIENAEENRVQVVFDGKPDADTRKKLKAAGFRWAPSQGAWQRLLNANGRAAAARVAKDLPQGEAAKPAPKATPEIPQVGWENVKTIQEPDSVPEGYRLIGRGADGEVGVYWSDKAQGYLFADIESGHVIGSSLTKKEGWTPADALAHAKAKLKDLGPEKESEAGWERMPEAEAKGKESSGGPYRYGLVYRPAGFGGTPKGGRVVKDPRFRHGAIEYDQPLSPEEVASYELERVLPEAEIEDRVQAVAQNLAKEYREEFAELLEEDERTAKQMVRQQISDAGSGYVGDYDALTDRVVSAFKAMAAEPLPKADKPKLILTEPKKTKAKRKPRKSEGKGSRKVKAVEQGEHVWGSRADLAGLRPTVDQLKDMEPAQQAKLVTRANLLASPEPEALLEQGVTPAGVLMRRALESMVSTKAADSLETRQYYMKGADFLSRSLDACKTPEDFRVMVREWFHLAKGREKGGTYSEAEVQEITLAYLEDKGIKRTVTEAQLDQLKKQARDARTGYAMRRSELWKELWEKLRRRPSDKRWSQAQENDPEMKRLKAQADDLWAKVSDLSEMFPSASTVLAWKEGVDRATTQHTEKGITVFREGEGYKPYSDDKNDYYKMALALGPRMLKMVETGGDTWSGGYYNRGQQPPKAWRDVKAFTADMQRQSEEKQLQMMREQLGGKAGAKRKGRARFSWERDVPGEVDRIGGRKVTTSDPKKFMQEFGLKNVQFGNWVSDADAEAHLQGAMGAMYDLADLIGVDPKDVSLQGQLSVGFGARGKGNARAHYEPGQKIINITKIAGGGTVAHEWAHALDHLVSAAGEQTTAAQQYLSHGFVEGVDQDVTDAMRTVLATMRWQTAGSVYASAAEQTRTARRLVEQEQELMALKKKSKETKLDYGEKLRMRRLNRSLKGFKSKKTEYMAGSETLGTYWSSIHEMFARAFEGWAEDKLQALGRKSSYLVSGTQRVWEASKPMADGKPAQGYPHGEERKAINEAIDQLVAAIAKSKALKKAADYLASLGRPRFTIDLEKATPVGGKTRAGYTVKMINGKRTYVKEGAGKGKAAAPKVQTEDPERFRQQQEKLATPHMQSILNAGRRKDGAKLAKKIKLPAHHLEGSAKQALDAIYDQAREVRNSKVEQAAYGVAHAIQTGRVSATAAKAIMALKGAEMAGVVEDVRVYTKNMGEVPRFLEKQFGGIRKSLVQVGRTAMEIVELEDLSKSAAPKGGKYFKRAPIQKAGAKTRWRYFYSQEDYDKHRGAHLSGEDTERAYLGSKIVKAVEAAGGKGCHPKELKGLVSRYGHRKVAQALRESVKGGKLSFKKGRFQGKATKGETHGKG